MCRRLVRGRRHRAPVAAAPASAEPPISRFNSVLAVIEHPRRRRPDYRSTTEPPGSARSSTPVAVAPASAEPSAGTCSLSLSTPVATAPASAEPPAQAGALSLSQSTPVAAVAAATWVTEFALLVA